MRKLGIYGGTFSPIHRGHTEAARVFYDSLALDELLIMPAFLPPHKTMMHEDTPKDRLAMARLAFEGESRRITVSDYEIEQGGKSYTYLTLQHFTAPDTALYFLCGTDMFLTLDRWREPQTIFALATIAHIRRRESDPLTEREILAAKERYETAFGARIIDLPCDPIAISSTEIRARCREGKPLSDLLPAQVEGYIRENRLYRGEETR